MNSIAAAADHFWLTSSRPSDEQCWIWTGSRDVGGYGVFSVDGGTQKAHRVAWELTNGPIPAGMFVCHHCDNPPCVNPGHLFLGTNADNVADMVRKGRHRTAPRLTSAQERFIIEMAEWSSQVEIAERLGIARGTVRDVLLRAGVHPVRPQSVRRSWIDGQVWPSEPPFPGVSA